MKAFGLWVFGFFFGDGLPELFRARRQGAHL